MLMGPLSIFGTETGTGASIRGAFVRTTVLGASGGSAADDIDTSAITAIAVRMIDFRKVESPFGAKSLGADSFL